MIILLFKDKIYQNYNFVSLRDALHQKFLHHIYISNHFKPVFTMAQKLRQNILLKKQMVCLVKISVV